MVRIRRGVALFGKHRPHQFVAQIKLGDDDNKAARSREIKAIARKFGARDSTENGRYLRFIFRETEDLKPFILGVEAAGKDVEVVSVGRNSEIVKQVGSPARLERTFGISGFRGTNGIGHTSFHGVGG